MHFDHQGTEELLQHVPTGTPQLQFQSIKERAPLYGREYYCHFCP
jgi:hypothetical protein